MSWLERNPREDSNKKHRKHISRVKGVQWEKVKNMHIATEAAELRIERQRNSGINPYQEPENTVVEIQDGFLKGLGFYDKK